jgi:hypothetical protein
MQLQPQPQIPFGDDKQERQGQLQLQLRIQGFFPFDKLRVRMRRLGAFDLPRS